MTHGLTIYADVANDGPIYSGNDGNDTVSESTGIPIYPGEERNYTSTDFQSQHTEYINMARIFVIGDGTQTYRLEYWVSPNAS